MGTQTRKGEMAGGPKAITTMWLINSASLKRESNENRKTRMKILERAMNKTKRPAIVIYKFNTFEHHVCF